ncbi:hypothetical protein GZL_01154 [Streptomyces sp. 769]|nr:hypothetical protein GZL_01154 [Streptomyces sp. 769]
MRLSPHGHLVLILRAGRGCSVRPDALPGERRRGRAIMARR